MQVGSVDTLRAVAKAACVSNKTASDWKTESDFPMDSDGNYPLLDIGKWIQRRQDQRLPKSERPQPVDADPLLAAGDSPGLERYRLAKAALAEMDLEQRRGETLPIDGVRAGIAVICQALRSSVEEIQRRFGPDAHRILDSALEGAERTLNDLFPEPCEDESDSGIAIATD